MLNEIKALREWLRERLDDGSDFLFNSQKGGRLDNRDSGEGRWLDR